MRRARPVLIGLILCFAICLARPGFASPFEDTVDILERGTSAHWGRDCFVWVVHYPEELIEPWVEAEALRSGMTEAEREAYRAAFVSELKLDSAETFLVSVYSFGPRSPSLAPASENIALLTSSGKRLSPTRYDSALDSSGGLVQGLVFFPRQADRDFAIAIKGMGVRDEQLFFFDNPPPAERVFPINANPEPEVVVVDIPKKKVVKAAPKKNAKSALPRVEPAPEVPPPPPVPREIPPLLQEDSSDMAAFVQSLRDRKPAERQEQGQKQEQRSAAEGQKTASAPQRNSESAYVSREYVLRQFLTLWADNRGQEMYDMLSEGSRRVLSRENFAREVAKASDLRAALKGDYRIEWVGEERAKVIADRRLLMFRSLVTRTLGVVREGSSWKIVW